MYFEFMCDYKSYTVNCSSAVFDNLPKEADGNGSNVGKVNNFDYLHC